MNDQPSFVNSLGNELQAGRTSWLRRTKRLLWSSAAVVVLASSAFIAVSIDDKSHSELVETAASPLPTSITLQQVDLESILHLLPSPTEIEITPNSNPDDLFVIASNGIAVIRIHGSNWTAGGGSIWICEDAQATGPNSVSCSSGQAGPISAGVDSGPDFTVDVVITSLHDGNQIMFSPNNGTAAQIVGRIQIDKPPFTLSQGPGIPARTPIDRGSRQYEAFGNGWAPQKSVTLYVCDEGYFPGAPSLSRCVETDRVTTDAEGSFIVVVDLPRFADAISTTRFGPSSPPFEGFSIVAIQGNQSQVVSGSIPKPLLSIDRSTDDAHVKVDVFDLLLDEIAEIRWCKNSGCDDSQPLATVQGDGTNRISVTVEIPPEATDITLWINGSSTFTNVPIREPEPGHPPEEVFDETDEQQAPPITIDSSPAVDEPFEIAPDLGLPSTWIAVLDEVTVQLLETETGAVLNDYGTIEQEARELGLPPPNFIYSAWPIPDTDDIAAFPCCEPAGGSGVLLSEEFQLEDYHTIFSGYSNVPSPTGDLIANTSQFGLLIHSSTRNGGSANPSERTNYFRSTTVWLRDDTGIVWGPIWDDYDTAEAYSEDSFEYVPDIFDTTLNRIIAIENFDNLSLAGDESGNVLVAGCTNPDDGCTEYALLTIDPTTGEELAREPIEQGARLGGTDPTGHYLIYTTADGEARWRGPNGTSGILGTGFSWATWGD